MTKKPDWFTHAIHCWGSEGRQDGDILTHDWIRWALQIPAPQNLEEAEEIQWVMLNRVETFKDWLLTEHKVALQSVRGKGYWVVPPSDQARYAAEEWAKHVIKAQKRAEALMENTRMDALTADERKRHIDTHIRMKGVSQLISKKKQDIFGLLVKPKVQ